MFLQLFLFCLLIFIIFKLNQRDRNLPPGELGLPIVGVFPYLGENIKLFFSKVKHKYGSIFCVKLGSRTLVFLRDFETIKAQFNKNELSSRPDFYTFEAVSLFQKLGLTFTNGPVWEANRKFALRHLRDFGFGKSSKMQDIIHREAEAMVQNLEQYLGEPIGVKYCLNAYVLNVIWGLVADERYDSNDPVMIEFSEKLEEDTKQLDGPMSLFNFFPFLIPIVPEFVKMNWMKKKSFMENRKKSFAFLERIIENHKKTLDRNNPRDYIDSYLIELEERETYSALRDPMANLTATIHDMFNAGMETTVTTMKWFMLYMAAFPHVQERVQKELDSVLPRDQLPLLDDKDSLPYLQATVYELMRHRPLTPFAVLRSNTEECRIEGYRIPKGSVVIGCVEECHYSPKYWEKPEDFLPERFLDENGRFRQITEGLLPFGSGKRLCLGEPVAKMEVFMFSGAIAQNFKISLPKGAKVNLKPDESAVIVSYPQPFKVVLEKRT